MHRQGKHSARRKRHRREPTEHQRPTQNAQRQTLCNSSSSEDEREAEKRSDTRRKLVLASSHLDLLSKVVSELPEWGMHSKSSRDAAWRDFEQVPSNVCIVWEQRRLSKRDSTDRCASDKIASPLSSRPNLISHQKYSKPVLPSLHLKAHHHGNNSRRKDRDEDERLRGCSPSARHSVIPGMGNAVTKDMMASSLEAFRSLLGTQDSEKCHRYMPQTYCLPEQLTQFESFLKSSDSSSVHIFKPSCGSQGKGIQLFKGIKGWQALRQKLESGQNRKSVMTVESERNSCIPRSVVQEYIANPYILDNLKSDLRLYVLVESNPLRIYLCNEGLVRFATVPYKRPSRRNIHDTCMHLTNYSCNKNASGYVHTSILDPDPSASSSGTKRTLTSVLESMRAKGDNVDKLMRNIHKLIEETVSGISLNLDGEMQKDKPFQILGFDILIDAKLNPVLLEVNANPSLSTDHMVTTTATDNSSEALCQQSTGDKSSVGKETKKLRVNSPVDDYIKSIVVRGALLIASGEPCKGDNEVFLEDTCYEEIPISDAVKRVLWIGRRVKLLYSRLCHGRSGLSCSMFCRTLRSALCLRGALMTSGISLRSVKSLKARRKRPSSAGRSGRITAYADTTSSASRVGKFEAGELLLLFAKTVGEDSGYGCGSFDKRMNYLQFMKALIIVGMRQYPEAFDNVTALDTLLSSADRVEKEARETLTASARNHSLGHLLMLKSKADAQEKKKRAQDALIALEIAAKKKRKDLTRIRLVNRKKEDEELQRRRKAHHDHQQRLLQKRQSEAAEKNRRRMEYEAWLRQMS